MLLMQIPLARIILQELPKSKKIVAEEPRSQRIARSKWMQQKSEAYHQKDPRNEKWS
jgi:hypothetical protein